METKRKCCKKAAASKEEKAQGAREYSGVAINRGDDNAVSPELVRERTSTLNNNPRNDQ
jgi:hypothetical protein